MPGRRSLHPLIRCTCGGSIGGHVALHGNGPAAERTKVLKYGCAYHKNRGAVACANGLTLRAETVDEAVLFSLRSLIAPDMVAEAITAALDILTSGRDEYAERRAALGAQVKDAEARTTKLVALTETAPDVTALLERLRAVQAEKAALLAKLDAMPPMPPTIDTEAIVSKLKAHAADLVGLLSVEHGPKVRALLRKLMPSPLTAEPVEHEGRRGYRLRGHVSLLGLVDGQVSEMLTHTTNSGTGGGPNGIRTRVAVMTTFLPAVSRGFLATCPVGTRRD